MKSSVKQVAQNLVTILKFSIGLVIIGLGGVTLAEATRLILYNAVRCPAEGVTALFCSSLTGDISYAAWSILYAITLIATIYFVGKIDYLRQRSAWRGLAAAVFISEITLSIGVVVVVLYSLQNWANLPIYLSAILLVVCWPMFSLFDDRVVTEILDSISNSNT